MIWSNVREKSHGNISIYSQCRNYCITKPDGLCDERGSKYRLLIMSGNCWLRVGIFDNANDAKKEAGKEFNLQSVKKKLYTK